MHRTLALLLLATLLSWPHARALHAVELWYDFEGDSGDLVTDKLLGDGAQDGMLEGNTTVQSEDVLFGVQSALFEIPDPLGPPPYSTFEVPGSTALGEDYTIAAHIDNREATLDFTHLFSSFRGTGSVGTDRILVDYDPSGSLIPGIRALVNNSVVMTASVPAGLASPGYHHFALTVDSGVVTIYFDGTEVASGNVGIGYSNSLNLHIGEDPHDGGGTGNEQLIGNIDEVLVIDRALSADQILGLTIATVDSVITPLAGEYAVYYDFEGDLGDQFAADGAQDAVAQVEASLDPNALNARFGGGSGLLELPSPSAEPYSRIEVGPVGMLGAAITISATVRFPQAGHSAGGLTRLFSSYQGTGSAAGDLIFDFNPDADVADIGLRLFLPDGTVVTSPNPSALNVRHTFTATYDGSDVLLYQDGVNVASGSTSGPVDLGAEPLYIGEDTGFIVNENFIGTLDDAFIVERALTPAEVLMVHQTGAASVIPEPPKALLLASGLLMLLVLRSARERKTSGPFPTTAA